MATTSIERLVSDAVACALGTDPAVIGVGDRLDADLDAGGRERMLLALELEARFDLTIDGEHMTWETVGDIVAFVYDAVVLPELRS